MGAIYKRELSGYFNSAIGYVVLAVYYFFSGLFFYLYCFYRDSASLGYVFANMFYIVMFIIPVLTMKTFSEERRRCRGSTQKKAAKCPTFPGRAIPARRWRGRTGCA